ncbi:flagellar hook-associated protein 2 [Listeria costaricensis]|uniref:flagellar hook-associated protein 2 n=1 Tax=Listeria costaricensis TaxID=2026604 RepID=UPI000C06F3A0|nr:flagellar hook-associated protein 2 [Listeria costaricensis]
MGSSIASSLMDPTQYYSQFIQLEQANLAKAKTPFQQQINGYQTKIDTYKSLKNALDKSLTTIKGFSTYESATKLATSSNEAAFSVSATSGSINGSYSIEVLNLATSDTYSKGVPDINQPIGVAGKVKLNGTEIEINATMTYKQVMEKINAAGAKVNAYSLGGNMVISANNTGVANQLKFEGDANVLQALGLDKSSAGYMAAKDATVKINGATVTSGTNKITNYIPGVTINIKNQTERSETLTVQDKKDDNAATMIKNFVQTINNMNSMLKAYTSKGGALQASAVDLETSRALNAIFSFSRGGHTLFDFGISVDKDGVMTVNEEKMKEVVAEDPAAVEKFFFGIGGVGDTLYQSLDKVFGTSGFISDETSSMNNEITKLNKKIDDIEARNSSMLDNITSQYNKWLKSMQLMQSNAMTLDALIDGMNGNKD